MTDIANIAKQIAGVVLPAAANIFVPGSGALAQKVIDAALGITGAPTPEVAVDVLQAHPDLQVQMRKAMLEHEEIMAEIGRKAADAERADQLKAAQQDIDDRTNARARDVALAQAGKSNERANVMVTIDAGGLAVCLLVMGVLTWLKATDTGQGISEGMFTALLTQLANFAAYFGLSLRDAHQFEFGSSRGSEAKTGQLVDLARQLPTAQQAPAPIEDHSVSR